MAAFGLEFEKKFDKSPKELKNFSQDIKNVEFQADLQLEKLQKSLGVLNLHFFHFYS